MYKDEGNRYQTLVSQLLVYSVCVCVHAVFDIALLHLALKLALYVSCLGQKTIIAGGS